MRLNDLRATEIRYQDCEYRMDLSFDNILDVFDVFASPDLTDDDKITVALELIVGPIEIDLDDSIDLLELIYGKYIDIGKNKKEKIEYDIKGNPLPKAKETDSDRIIDFSQDAAYIYASFRQAYGINLLDEQGKLSWVEFNALVGSLPEGTIMRDIMQIRSWRPRKGESSEYRAKMRDLQRIYALEEEVKRDS